MIYLKDGDAFYGWAFAGYGEQFIRYLESNPQLPGRRSVGARVLLTGEVQNIPDLQADSEYDRHLLATTQHRAVLGVPLLRDQTIVEAIVVGRQTPEEFTQCEIELVQTFADQAVIAIENTRLFDQVQAQTRDLEESLRTIASTPGAMESRGRHRRLSPFVQPRSLPRAPWSVNVTTPGATGRRRLAAWGDAITTMGRLDASVTLAAILQRGGAIVSAGGCLRTLTAKARQGAFATGPFVVAGLKAKSQVGAPPRKTRRADP
jgi:GAF domain-containing protein